MEKKDIILFVNNVDKATCQSLLKYARQRKLSFKIAIIKDNTKKDWEKKTSILRADIVIGVNPDKPLKIVEALRPYQERFLAITCRGEGNIGLFSKIIPHLPYLRTPSVESLNWSTDKLAMRQRFYAYDKTITPRFMVATDSRLSTIREIKKKIGFPLVIKPANLASSLLVSICFHEQELVESLKKTFRKITKVYKDNAREIEPKILAEEFMEGGMYSIDGYVTSRGRVYFCPMAHVKTGRAIGFDDFFGYQCLIPTALKKSSIQTAQDTTAKAIRALGLRSTTVHVELMRAEGDKWKVIEVGPRKGGFRSKLYQMAYGIDHNLNDVLIRIPNKPIISKKLKGYAVLLKFFAKNEGTLANLKGINSIKKIHSFVEWQINKKIGDKCLYAKNGGNSVCNLYLFNKNRSDLLADIRRAEKFIEIKTEK
ncbi:MAG: hypothetical protein COU31_02220 [Candidatus Magasanikbacteria bacterium CG10_big_fil_rev_8_21_14_0_10_40_10]|uniref:ATP-grasp domain-containing protein n=1 Tax=Candidatus Magasanikbacteria bacterium CG10_big_fil_rev_8_21_14_0_10_40_10 TaxID=1974648 RepID=A0A2M6W468_9BACT|nr:MAG: hypothetical protein COU31_02220 [Candidatus Magasanikbacteria bacterium CG10_big_fil_rev_8_21_14_0_10_40_10]